MSLKPFRQRDDLLVGPHPSRPALEGVQDFAGAFPRVRETFDVAVDAITIGPVAFDGDEGKTLLSDEPTADLGSPGVILRRAVGGFAQKDISRVSDVIEQRVEVRRLTQRSGHHANLSRRAGRVRAVLVGYGVRLFSSPYPPPHSRRAQAGLQVRRRANQSAASRATFSNAPGSSNR